MLVRTHGRARYCILHTLLQCGALILLLAPSDQWEGNRTCGGRDPARTSSWTRICVSLNWLLKKITKNKKQLLNFELYVQQRSRMLITAQSLG